jgi:hypothetical protein
MLPVPLLDWPADLFSDDRAATDADWIDIEPGIHAGPHTSTGTARHSHAGVAA